MTVPMLDLKAEYASIKGEIDSALANVLSSGAFILGPNVSAFEKEFADYIGTKYALGVASGTDALFLSLKALGIGAGDEVITSPLTFFATSEAISYTGAKPVFVDADPETHNIDAIKIEKAVTKATKAIIPVHLWGLPADMDPIMQTAKKHGLFIVEDCAQAAGAKYRSKKVGSYGSAGCFSFFPTKNLGCYGDGGMITTNDDAVYEKLKLLHLHGSKSRGVHEIIGYNSRLDEIQAAILRVKLRYLDKWNDARRKNAAYYTSEFLSLGIKCPAEPQGTRHVYHQYTMEMDGREPAIEHLKANGVSAFVYYPNPLHLQKAYDNLGYKKGDFPESEKIGLRMLSIPVHPFLSDSEKDTVTAALKGFKHKKAV
ncbi:MAG: DegT/DnrJ/EryC1/StrS family aminotransferase [Candidatus Margulisiibacteriota bacterium]